MSVIVSPDRQVVANFQSKITLRQQQHNHAQQQPVTHSILL